MNVVVVESPAKAKTISNYLGGEYQVLASSGHIRDLPEEQDSVLPDENFEMIYETKSDKKTIKILKEIARAVKDATHLYLATDPDREGEAIGWHLLAVLKEMNALNSITVQRVVFHSITKSSVRKAMENPRELDMNLVNAQQARRALDYLFGFNICDNTKNSFANGNPLHTSFHGLPDPAPNDIFLSDIHPSCIIFKRSVL